MGSLMNFPELHLLLNHFPIIGTIIGLGLFVISLGGKSQDLRRASLIIFSAMALLALPVFFSGPGAEGAIKKLPGVSEALIERHHGAAMLALLFMEMTGALSLVELWKSHEGPRAAHWNWNLSAVLLLSIVTAGLMARVGNTGGDIRHPEIGVRNADGAETTTISRIVRRFEPSADGFAELMTTSKWWWAFMMDLHFIGLALLIGTVGILDLRMLGLGKGIAIGEFSRRMIPWAGAGFLLNVITGFIMFAGAPNMFYHNRAFGYKMLFIAIAGLNVLVFYVTGVARKVEALGSGDDAPWSAKVVAGLSLFLWVGVMFWGRMLPFLGNAF